MLTWKDLVSTTYKVFPSTNGRHPLEIKRGAEFYGGSKIGMRHHYSNAAVTNAEEEINIKTKKKYLPLHRSKRHNI